MIVEGWPITTMRGLFVLLLVAIVSVFYADAFLPNPYGLSSRHYGVRQEVVVHANGDKQQPSTTTTLLTHEDIIWKLRPPPETSLWRKFVLRMGANLIRIDCRLKGQDPPFCLCPKGGQAVLEAHYQNQKIGRFGISTLRGPPAPPIDESARDLFGLATATAVGTAAIVYMVVEKPFRKRGVGRLALDVIATIHATQGCDFTILVADDDGSGKLIEWYQQHGFGVAPKLQALLGSPNGEYGTTMMAPTRQTLDEKCRLKWW